MLLGRSAYEWMEGRVRLFLTVVDLDCDFEPSQPAVPAGNVTAFFPLGSVQINLEDWSFTGEYGQINLKRSGPLFAGFPPFLQEATTENAYVQVQYRFAPRWSALARYDSFATDIDDRDGSARARLTGLPRHRFFAKDLTFGARWEFARDWLVAAEYHNIHGTAWLSTVDNPMLDSDGGDGHWDLFTLMLSYRF